VHKAVNIVNEVHRFAVAYPVALVHEKHSFYNIYGIAASKFLQGNLNMVGTSVIFEELFVTESFN